MLSCHISCTPEASCREALFANLRGTAFEQRVSLSFVAEVSCDGSHLRNPSPSLGLALEARVLKRFSAPGFPRIHSLGKEGRGRETGRGGGLRVVFHPASRLTRAPARRLLSSSGYGVAWALYRSDLQQVWPEVWPFGFYLTAAVEFQQPSTGFSCQFGANVLRPQDPTYDGRADGSTAGVRPHEGRKNERVGRRLNALRPAVSLPVWSLSPTGT